MASYTPNIDLYLPSRNDADVDVDTSLSDNFTKIDSSLAQSAKDYVSASKYGFVADYVGIPQYDGNDGSRITCTDNTASFAAMLDDCIAEKNLTVYFPRGHYGIKTGNITKDLTGCKLTIIGDGTDATIIDYVKEDNTKTSYVGTSNANRIATIKNADKVIIKDIHIKATTNRNNVSGNQGGSNDVYYGAVWGLIFETFNHLRMEKVKVSRFNYRGITTHKPIVTSNSDCNPLVEIIDCFGTENKGSGFWINRVQEVKVIGGEFSFNGQLGIGGTGYGVTCAEYVGKAIVKGSYFHNNYRKGFDTHGCLSVTLDNVIFKDHIVYHTAILGFDIFQTDNTLTFNNLLMLQGQTVEDRAWLKSCYDALLANGLTGYRFCPIAIFDTNSALVPRTYLKKVLFNNINLKGAYNGYDVITMSNNAALNITAPSAVVTIDNSIFDFTDWRPNTEALNASCPISVDVLSLSINKTNITWVEDATYRTFKGALILYPNSGIANRSVKFIDTRINLNNSYLLGRYDDGVVGDPLANASTTRVFDNVTVSWVTLPSTLANETKYFGEVTDIYPKKVNNVKATVGDYTYNLPLGKYFNDTKGQFLSITNAISTGVDILEIILENNVTTYAIEVEAFNDYLKVVNDTIKTDGISITFKSRASFVDTDGRTKTKITLSSKAGISAGSYYVRANVRGSQGSWGIERFNKLTT
jgi:hypothetical protein